jgi:tetratricopeptide (TPR) repeat protein
MKTIFPHQITRLKQMLAAAQQAQRSGMHVQAANLYRDVLKDAPEAHDVRHQFAVLLATSGHPQEAAKQFRQILKANPTHAATHANLANVLTEDGQYDEAITEFRRALALDPGLLWAHAHLGSALRLTGKAEEAIAHFRQALDMDKKNAFAFNGMGVAYRDLDDIPRALECLEHAVGLAPQNADFRINFGATLNRAQIPDLAVEQFYKAAELQPNRLEAIVMLGETLSELRRFDDAKECLDRALTLHPEMSELSERRGFVFLEMGDTGHALADFDSVLQQYPQRPMALLGAGRTHMEAGHSKEASATLEKLVELYPDTGTGYFYLAASRKFRPDDPVIPQLKKLADKTGSEDKASIALNFALGKIYDDCKQWDEAFAYYAQGNRLRNEEYQYQPGQEEARIDDLISVFNHALFEKHRACGAESNLPVLIVGMPRSGTTLTEQIISSHRLVAGAGEVVFWSKASQSMPYTLKTSLPYPQCMEQIVPEKAAEVADRYVNLLLKIAGPGTSPVRITDKFPHNFLNLGLIALLFPNSPIIHCKRNAMDNCLSIFFQHFGGRHPYAYDLANLGHHYRQYERLMAHWHAVLPGRILDINYEDTIADPEYWSRKLIEHVKLGWDDACLAPHKQERTVKTASHWQVRQPIYKTSVQRWKNYEKHLGPLKEALGYRD